MDSGEVEEIEEGTEEGSEDFGRGVEGNGGRGFEKRDLFRGGKKVVFDEEVDA